MTDFDALTQRFTAFASFREMVEGTASDYAPTFSGDALASPLPDAYDQTQERRGDARRSIRLAG